MSNVENGAGFSSKEKVVRATIVALAISAPIAGFLIRRERRHDIQEMREKEVKLEKERIDYISDSANFAGA